MKDLIDWNNYKSITAIEYAELNYVKLNEPIFYNRLLDVIHSSAVYIIKKDDTIVHVGSTLDLNRRAYEHTRVNNSKASTSCLNNLKTKKLKKKVLGLYKLYYIKESLNLDKDNLSNLEANIGDVFSPAFDTSYRKIDNEKVNKKLKIKVKND